MSGAIEEQAARAALHLVASAASSLSAGGVTLRAMEVPATLFGKATQGLHDGAEPLDSSAPPEEASLTFGTGYAAHRGE